MAKAPNYASAHNNRAQLLRRIYGDGLLVSRAVVDAAEAEAAAAAPAAVEGEGDKDLNEGSLWGDNTNAMEKLLSPSEISDEERARVASTILTDLTTAIELLMPATYRTPVSPQAARTLANAYTQRGAVYLATARLMRRYSSRLQEPQRHIFEDMAIMDRRIYGGRGPVDFEEAAAADFAAAARFGGELARRLAVPANPTAKLCGEMVRAAMREEYGDVFAGGAKEDGQ